MIGATDIYSRWQWDKKSEENRGDIPNLVCFAVPCYVMCDEHIDYTVAAVTQLYKRRHTIPGVGVKTLPDD